jgi:hypothetical protein
VKGALTARSVKSPHLSSYLLDERDVVVADIAHATAKCTKTDGAKQHLRVTINLLSTFVSENDEKVPLIAKVVTDKRIKNGAIVDILFITETVRQVEINLSPMRDPPQNIQGGKTGSFSQLLNVVLAISRGDTQN